MRGHLKDILIFIIVAAGLLGLADYYVMGGRDARKAEKPSPYTQIEPAPLNVPEPQLPGPPPVLNDGQLPPPPEGDDGFDFFNDEYYWEFEEDEELGAIVTPPAPAAEEPSLVVVPPTPTIARGEKPRIAIIIDDVGMNKKWSEAAVNLPAPVTMAILPYAEHAADFAKISKAKGHDILIHTPMEAMHAPVSLGGMGLTTDMGEAEIIAMMELIALKLDGYIGINNHMGSKFTSDRAAMERLMPYLKKRGLIFVDSKTIGNSVAASVAAEQGVPNASRDVFLDHEETADFVARALIQAERVAHRKGYAIAIGHPKAVTITGLQQWIPTLEAKGIELVGISTLVTSPAAPLVEEPAPVTASEPTTPAPETAPDLPRSEQLLLYSPSPEIRY